MLLSQKGFGISCIQMSKSKSEEICQNLIKFTVSRKGGRRRRLVSVKDPLDVSFAQFLSKHRLTGFRLVPLRCMYLSSDLIKTQVYKWQWIAWILLERYTFPVLRFLKKMMIRRGHGRCLKDKSSFRMWEVFLRRPMNERTCMNEHGY